ncbi:MAG: electron transfer flavoprotein subunit alpha/FixB family protein [Alphaproteobacteria bacterium]
MAILVIAEHDNAALKPSTLNTVTAASKLGGEIHVLVAGENCSAVSAQAAQINGVSKVLGCDSPAFAHALAENLGALIAQIGKNYSHILAPASTFGKNILPRAAALLDVQQISEVSAIVSGDTFERPIYGGQAMATVKSSDAIKLLTIRTTGFDAAQIGGGAAAQETISFEASFNGTKFISIEASKSDRPELGSAKIVVSGGRGVGSGEDYKRLIEPLADKLGAAVGASRAAVDAGYVPNDYQVGQTGKVVAPELYIAIGISGAIQHLAGMKDSKVIVAINKDADAPIFSVADYGLVADLFQAVPELTEKL